MRKARILIGFTTFGIIAGVVSAWWSQISDNVFWLNLPGVLAGDALYSYSIAVFGNPHSDSAHYTIPWILRIPQVYVLTSTAFWGISGLIIQAIRNIASRKHELKQANQQ